jgi:hypothetical protein
MFRTTIASLTLAALTAPTGVWADAFPNPPQRDSDVIPTDAIRIELDEEDKVDCAERVIWAFNLPRGSLVYSPRCEIRDLPAPYTSARNR